MFSILSETFYILRSSYLFISGSEPFMERKWLQRKLWFKLKARSGWRTGQVQRDTRIEQKVCRAYIILFSKINWDRKSYYRKYAIPHKIVIKALWVLFGNVCHVEGCHWTIKCYNKTEIDSIYSTYYCIKSYLLSSVSCIFSLFFLLSTVLFASVDKIYEYFPRLMCLSHSLWHEWYIVKIIDGHFISTHLSAKVNWTFTIWTVVSKLIRIHVIWTSIKTTQNA